MKNLLSNFITRFNVFKFHNKDSEFKNFFDYPESVQAKMYDAAGREAQKVQAKLLREYDSRFGTSK